MEVRTEGEAVARLGKQNCSYHMPLMHPVSKDGALRKDYVARSEGFNSTDSPVRFCSCILDKHSEALANQEPSLCHHPSWPFLTSSSLGYKPTSLIIYNLAIHQQLLN